MKKAKGILVWLLLLASSVVQAQQTTAKVPDNVFDPICTAPVAANEFDIEKKFEIGGVNSMTNVVVGDIDGDGNVEILACGQTSSSPYYSKNILVIDGKTQELERTITTPSYYTYGIGLAIADVDKDGLGEVFLLCEDYKIHCYNYLGSEIWESSAVDLLAQLSIADINADGTPEAVCGKYIFNAVTGDLLHKITYEKEGTGFTDPHGHSLSSSSNLPYKEKAAFYMYALYDFDGDGTLEMAAGNSLYKINLNGTETSSTTLRIANTTPDIKNIDGGSIVADFDNDGDADIIVIAGQKTGLYDSKRSSNVYVWDGQTDELIGQYTMSEATREPSVPFCGDINNDGKVEVCFCTSNGLSALQYSETEEGHIKAIHSDYEAIKETSGFTAFDFNQDGRDEFVCRDMESMYIVDGETLESKSEPITAYSGTIMEFPVVADVDGDGHAEIIITQAYKEWKASKNSSGVVAVYGSAKPGAWSSARKVWNQYHYNSVNINEDLTVPALVYDLTTEFKNGKKPFNNFHKQLPYIDMNGDLFNLAPDLKITSPANNIGKEENDTIVFSNLTITNEGSSSSVSPLCIRIDYANDTTKVFLDTCINKSIEVNENYEITLKIASIAFEGLEAKARITVNPYGEYRQPECNYTNNSVTISYLSIDNTIRKPCGDGTEACPFHITTPGELLYFAAVINGNIDTIPVNEYAQAILDSDIDLSKVCSEELGSWTPIGYSTDHRFRGVFNGHNHVIKNIYVNGITDNQGLFGVATKADIRNVIIGSGIIKSSGSCVGSIVGVGVVTIIDCHNYANIECSNKFNGGIIGYAGKDSYIEKCHNEGNILGTNSNKTLFGVGGIAGASSEGTVTDCYNLGTISGQSSRVGGIVGSAENCLVTNCYSYGDVESKANDYGGGICAIAKDYPNTKVEHSYYYNSLDKTGQQPQMQRPQSDFNDGTIYSLLNEHTPNLWRQEEGKYPAFIDTVYNPISYQKFYARICQGDSIEFGGKTIKAPGIYTNECSCQSDTLVVEFETAGNTQTVSLCKGDSIFFNGQYIKEAGTYTTATGDCSEDKLIVTVLLPSIKELTDTINKGESYTFGDKIITEEGSYTNVIEGGAANGCDSIVVLNLVSKDCEDQTIDFVETICEGETYHFGEKQITEAGDYYYRATATNGCDSITHLKLVVAKKETTSINATADVNDDSFDQFGFNISPLVPGTTIHTLNLTNQYGCDSIVTLQLSVVKPVDNVVIPTLFTPHTQEGKNDIFMPGYELYIYDRYGNLVCHSTNGWDGKYRGELADPGVYIYTIYMKDDTKKNGSIEIFK